MNQNEYVRLSLELHLFFDRIMKEHSFFLEAGFLEKDQESKKIASDFQKSFSNILERAVVLANGNISKDLLESNEIITNNTLDAENKTSNLSGIRINTDITMKEARLRSGSTIVNGQLLHNISNLNRETLPLIQSLIDFKNRILNQVLSCQMYTTNYPLLIKHIINEAQMYHDLLSQVENKQPLTNDYLYKQELFWDNTMKEHAEFIRRLLDPSEKTLNQTADKYATEYEVIINKYKNNSLY